MNWILFTRKRKPGWLAFGLHQDRVDLVHIRRAANGRPEVVLCDSFRKEGGDAATLARLRKELKLDQYRLTTLLGSEHYQLHQLDAPNVPREELKAAVRWSVKASIDYPLESATVDVLDIPVNPEAPSADHSVYAVTAKNSAIEHCIQPFKESKLALEAIDIPELAQRNVAALFERDGHGVALFAFYEREAILTFSHAGELYTTRRIEMPLAQLITDDATRRNEQFERIALALQRSLDHFEHQYRHLPLTRLLLGPLPQDSGLQARLASDLALPVETIDLAAVMDFSGAPELKHPARQSQCLSTIGAALRGEEAAA